MLETRVKSGRLWHGATIGTVIVVLLGTVIALGLTEPSWASAKPPKATVSSFAASPKTLTWTGGAVTLSATVTNATSCAFSSVPVIAGLPATVACVNGSVSQLVSIPPNSGKTAIKYTFSLSVVGATKTVKAPSVKLTVPIQPAPTIPSFTVTPSSVSTAGGVITLSAVVTNATTCTFSSVPTFSGLPTTVPCSSGSASVTVTIPANAKGKAVKYTFSLSVQGRTTIGLKEVLTTVPGATSPTVSAFAAAEDEFAADGGNRETPLSAIVSNATSCKFSSEPAIAGLPATVPCTNGTVSQDLTVPVNTTGADVTYTLTLAVTNGSTTMTATTTITVAAAGSPGGGGSPVISSFTASPTTLVSNGGTVKLAANVSDASSCTFSSSPSSVSGLRTNFSCASGTATDSVTVPANSGTAAITYIFTLAATGSSTVSQTANVTVSPPPTVVSFGASPKTLSADGGSVTLSADITNGKTCTFSSDPAVPDLPSTTSCASGSVSQVVDLPANATTTASVYTFTLSVTDGETAVSAETASQVTATNEMIVCNANGSYVVPSGYWVTAYVSYPALCGPDNSAGYDAVEVSTPYDGMVSCNVGGSYDYPGGYWITAYTSDPGTCGPDNNAGYDAVEVSTPYNGIATCNVGGGYTYPGGYWITAYVSDPGTCGPDNSGGYDAVETSTPYNGITLCNVGGAAAYPSGYYINAYVSDPATCGPDNSGGYDAVEVSTSESSPKSVGSEVGPGARHRTFY
jgi:hypothetical protein